MPKDNETTTNELDADAMLAIRAMLDDETPAEPLVKRGRAAPAPAAAPSRRSALPDLEPDAHLADDMPPPAPKRRAKNAGRSEEGLGRIDQIKQSIAGYRPKARHLAIGAAVLLVLFKPWLVFGLFMLSIFIMIGVFLIVGYDGFWRGIMSGVRWYAERRPDRADALHRRLDNFAMRWDGFLDRFPEGSVDGLYLPDLGALEVAEKKHDEALDRRFQGLRKS